MVMLGIENAGKSTLISVLINNEKDNGKGKASKKIHKTLQEFLKIKTMQIYTHLLGFD